MVYSDGSLTEEEINYQLAHLNESKIPSIIATLAVLSVLATISVFLRFIVRWHTTAEYKMDDWTILVAFVLSWGSFVAIYYETKCGLGKHSLAITPEQTVGLLKAFVYAGPNFVTGVCLTQLSMLLLYRRVFTVNTPWFRYSLYGLASICIVFSIVFFCTIVFSCSPVRGLWDKSLNAKCYEIRNVYIAHTALILAIDIAIVAVPMPLVWNLHANVATKGAVAGLFLLGSFVCVINLIKLPYLARNPGADPLWDDVPASIWTHAEFTLGIVSACLPCFRPLFKRVGGVFTSDTKSKKSTLTQPPNRSKLTTDTYRSLNGKEAGEDNGSKIALVSPDHWTKNKARVDIKGGFVQENGVESTTPPPHAIGVTKDVHISTSNSR